MLYLAILSHGRLWVFLLCSLFSLSMWLYTAVCDSVCNKISNEVWCNLYLCRCIIYFMFVEPYLLLVVLWGVLLCIVHLVGVRAPIVCFGGVLYLNPENGL
jgi:hypothetical protein